jgi:uncharacterized protein YbaR (Trm112 family)
MEKQILTYLKCLVCGGESLEMGNDKIACNGCGASYPIKDGIPILVRPERQAEILNQWDLTDYRDIYNESTPRVGDLIKKYTAHGTMALDAGCGLGAYNNYFLGDLISFDISPFYVKETRKKYELPGRYFFVADARDIPLKKNVLSLILCASMLEHLPKEESDAVINFFINNLSPRNIIIEVPNDSNQLVALMRNLAYGRAMREAKASIVHTEEDHYRIFTVRDLKKFSFKVYGCIGWTSRQRFPWPKFWNLYDKIFWYLPALAGDLIGIYKK